MTKSNSPQLSRSLKKQLARSQSRRRSRPSHECQHQRCGSLSLVVSPIRIPTIHIPTACSPKACLTAHGKRRQAQATKRSASNGLTPSQLRKRRPCRSYQMTTDGGLHWTVVRATVGGIKYDLESQLAVAYKKVISCPTGKATH